jgi:sulfur relay (sulfurtransferase) DsrC/TusE family protein
MKDKFPYKHLENNPEYSEIVKMLREYWNENKSTPAYDFMFGKSEVLHEIQKEI